MRRFALRTLGFFLIYGVQRLLLHLLDIREGDGALIMSSIVYALLLDLTDRFERHEREDWEEGAE